MNHIASIAEENKAALAFGEQAAVFDSIYSNDPAIAYKRKRVREHLLSRLHPSSWILELNCGTGEDARFLAEKGFRVHATDVSENMMVVAKEKLAVNGLCDRVSFEKCSFNKLEELMTKGPFDHIFSNFGGLNCTTRLDLVLESFEGLLKKDGQVTLVIISKFSIWETLLFFIGKWKTAFRRFRKKGSLARVEGHEFHCTYYAPSYVKKHLKNFTITGIEGLCIFVPPSYIQHFSIKYPLMNRFLSFLESLLKCHWPWNRWGDYFIITAIKNN